MAIIAGAMVKAGIATVEATVVVVVVGATVGATIAAGTAVELMGKATIAVPGVGEGMIRVLVAVVVVVVVGEAAATAGNETHLMIIPTIHVASEEEVEVAMRRNVAMIHEAAVADEYSSWTPCLLFQLLFIVAL